MRFIKDLTYLHKKTFVKYLKDNVTRSTLYDALDVKKTTIDHWFRNDKYFSYPSMEDWEKTKPYLKVIKYDEEMTTIESFEWQKQKWQTLLVTSSRPSTAKTNSRRNKSKRQLSRES